MKKMLLGIALALAATSAQANTSYIAEGKVTDIRPIYTQVRQNVNETVCRNVEVPVYGTVQGQGDAAGGALAGMIIGGILGKGISGNDDGAAAGAVIGGLIGADKGAKGTKQVITGYRTERQCHEQPSHRTVNVVNEYDITYRVEGRLVTMRVNRAQGERAYVNQRVRFRVRYQPLN